jgi:hypothetical protein
MHFPPACTADDGAGRCSQDLLQGSGLMHGAETDFKDGAKSGYADRIPESDESARQVAHPAVRICLTVSCQHTPKEHHPPPKGCSLLRCESLGLA